MKLLHTEYDLNITFKENQIHILSIENPKVYSRILNDLWSQSHGGEGDFVLSEGEKIKNIGKEIECIFNPFALDCNDKKIIGKLYQELKEQAGDLLFEESMTLNTDIVKFIDKVLNQVPYALNYNTDFDIMSLFKIYDVGIECVGKTLIEHIVEYLKVMSQICMVKYFVFVGLKQYLSKEEIEQLYEFVFYEKINLIIVEAVHSEHVSGEKCWLIDKDLCIIEL